MKVTIYTTPTCGYCHQAKSFLDSLGVAYTEHDVSRDRAAAQEMVRLTGQMGVPVITVDNEVIIGFDRERLQGLLAGASKPKPPRFGLKIADAAGGGAVVGGVSPGLTGERAGLRAGDVITGINSARVNRVADMERVLSGLRPGGIVSILFRRAGQPRKSEILI
jgi:glutaredoxin 3